MTSQPPNNKEEYTELIHHQWLQIPFTQIFLKNIEDRKNNLIVEVLESIQSSSASEGIDPIIRNKLLEARALKDTLTYAKTNKYPR